MNRNKMNRNKWLSVYLPLILSRMPNMEDNTVYVPSKPKEKKCLLSRCKNMTTHNGGYCCAEHCKEDK
jgi:hypothetical protein